MSHVDDGALHAYLDGELSPAERVELEAHLAGCAACRTRLADERALVQRAGELLGRALPPERAAPPLQQLGRRRTVRRWGIPLSWAASVLLAVSLGYYMRGADAPVMGLTGERAAESVNDGYRFYDSVVPFVSNPTAPAEPVAGRASARRALPPTLMDTIVTAELASRADQVAANQATDKVQSPLAGSGVTPIRDRAELRAATPRDAAPQAAAPARAAPAPAAAREAVGLVEGAVVSRQQRYTQLTTEWPIIRRASARQMLGADPVGIPGLAVRQMRTSPGNDGTVLVEQAIDSSTVIQLYQRRFTAGLERDALTSGTTERLARFMGELRVEIAGPLSQDSLNKLLEQLKPLP